MRNSRPAQPLTHLHSGNDFSESSYIADTLAPQIVPGAGTYVNGFPHSAFRSVLPYFIAAYKAGRRDVAPPTGAKAIAWYRTTPAGICGDGGTVWGQGGTVSARQGARDVVSVITISTEATTVNLKIGDKNQAFKHQGCATWPVCYFEMPFQGSTGPVSLSLGGRWTTGPAIMASCPAAGRVRRLSFLRAERTPLTV